MKKKNYTKEKLETLRTRLKKNIKKYYDSGQTTTIQSFEIGLDFIELKKYPREKGEKWEPFAKRMAPYLEKRTRQRCMKFARSILKEDIQILGHLSKNTLDKIISIAPDKHIVRFINDNGINIKEAPVKTEEISNLINGIDELLKKTESNKKKKKKKNNSDSEIAKPTIKDTIIRVEKWLKKMVDDNKTPKNETIKKLKNIVILTNKIIKQTE